MQVVFKRKMMTMFNMNKFLSSHVKPLGEIDAQADEKSADGDEGENADDGSGGDDDDEPRPKKPAKSTALARVKLCLCVPRTGISCDWCGQRRQRRQLAAAAAGAGAASSRRRPSRVRSAGCATFLH